jgi:anion-transporting  ArsA/GET3 family ATPase
VTSLLNLDLLWVTGKGGVGKTSTAAAIAEVAARSGRSTLVCEMDAKGALALALGVDELDFTPVEVAPNLHAMSMSTEDALREYLRLFVRIPFIGRIGPLAKTFDFVADAAPGVKEILSVGKLCFEVREKNYDLIVVDAESTGHIVSQIGAPKVIADQTQWMLDILNDADRTGVAVVTTPEEMPVTESSELLRRLTSETGAHPAVVIANRVLPVLFDRREQAVVDQLDAALPVLIEAVGPGARAVLEAARFTDARRRTGAQHLGRLRSELDAADPPLDIPIITVPELFARNAGRRVVSLIADGLADELDVEIPRDQRANGE